MVHTNIVGSQLEMPKFRAKIFIRLTDEVVSCEVDLTVKLIMDSGNSIHLKTLHLVQRSSLKVQLVGPFSALGKHVSSQC